MAAFEVLEEIARLQSPGLTDTSSDEVDGDGVGAVGRHDGGKDELGEFGDARDGVEVCFAEGANAHDAEDHGEDKGEDCEAEANDTCEGVLNGEDAENERKDEADERCF